MSNKDLEALYQKVLLRENETLDSIGISQSGHIHGTDEKDRDDKEFDILDGDEDIDPLEEDEEAPKKALRELVAAVEHLSTRHQNVVDGAKTERSFLKEVEQLMPIIRSILGKISL
jgi:DNA-directed RNA polymerase specialized sigma subunit